MPQTDRRPFPAPRARRILRLVGMNATQFRERYNRVTGQRTTAPLVSDWLTGKRPLPAAAVVYLKALVWCARSRRTPPQSREGE